MLPWRSVFAWFALVPLFWALFAGNADEKHATRRGFLLGYLCGVLWYCGNCYWIRNAMEHYGDMPPLAPTLLLIGFSLVLGLYFGLFGLLVTIVFRRSGKVWVALATAPIIWVALDLAAARITSVPWDQLGYSQVDNQLVIRLAPWTGVYGITFLLVAVNALILAGLTITRLRGRVISIAAAALMLLCGWAGMLAQPPKAETSAMAVLIQPNLNVGGVEYWTRPGEWSAHMAEFLRLAQEQCKSYIAGIREPGRRAGKSVARRMPRILTSWCGLNHLRPF